MKKFEKVLAILIVIGLVMKLLMITGRGVILVLSFSTLAIFYQFLSFAYFNDIPFKGIFKKESYKDVSALRIIGTVVLGFSLSALLVGLLFKFQFYAGANMMVYQGLFCLLICLIVAYIRYTKNKSSNYIRMFNRIAIIGGFGLFISLVPRMYFFEILHRDQPAYVEAVKKLNEDPNNKEYQDELQRQKDSIFGENK